LSKQQESLLKRMIAFDSFELHFKKEVEKAKAKVSNSDDKSELDGEKGDRVEKSSKAEDSKTKLQSALIKPKFDEAAEFKARLYEFFFMWDNKKKEENEKDLGYEDEVFDPWKEEERQRIIEEEREEKRKKAQLKRDQELIEFEERGGFVRVLRDIFNPVDKAAMQLDPVF